MLFEVGLVKREDPIHGTTGPDQPKALLTYKNLDHLIHIDPVEAFV